MMFNLPQERLNIAISAVAGTQYAFDLTVEYVKVITLPVLIVIIYPMEKQF